TCLPAGGPRQGRRLEARSDGRSRRSARLGRKRAFDPLQAPTLDDRAAEEDSRCSEYEQGNLGSPVTPSSIPFSLFLRRAVLQLAARKALAQVVQSRDQRIGDFANGKVDLLHGCFPWIDPGRSNALFAQFCEPRPRCLLGFEHAQGNRKSELGIFLHDIEVFDAELPELGGLLVCRLPIALGRHKYPVARDLFHAALRESRPEGKRFKSLLHARSVTRAECAELEARGESRLGRRFGALCRLLRSLGGKGRKLAGTEQSDRLRVE